MFLFLSLLFYLLSKRLSNFMTVVDKIRDEKLEYDINRQAAKITALSSGKTEKYEYLTSEEILPFN